MKVQRGAACMVSSFFCFQVCFLHFFFWYIFILLTISNMTSLIMEDCGGERPSVQIVNNEKSRNCFTSFSSLQINAGFGFAQKFMMRTLAARGET